MHAVELLQIKEFLSYPGLTFRIVFHVDGTSWYGEHLLSFH